VKIIANIVLVFLICNSVNILGQRAKTEDNIPDKEKELMAENALQEEKYEKAVLLYKKLLDKKPDNSKLNFLVGYCYLNTDYGKKQAIEYFEKAVANIEGNNKDSAPLETYYYLAKAYYDDYKFNKAIEVLEELLMKIPQNESFFKFKVGNLKIKCKNGNKVSQNKLKIKVENLFDINSKYSDHSPIINHNETELIFTSRREGSKLRVKNYDGQYDANIYTSLKIDSAWQMPYSISNTVNSSSHETASFISADYKTMIIHKHDRNKGSLYRSKRKETGDWDIAVSLGPNINSRYRETAACLSQDGKKLYFVSDRKSSYGGLDIYVSEKLNNGSWGKAKNLGANINTPFDEETPFIHKNGTLFFCSQGHGSMGGFDIFASSKIDENKWSNPVNLGVPVNSVEDDFFYIPSADGKFAYFASKRQGGKGNSDIYRIELIKSENNYAVVSGKIKVAEKNQEVKIHITDLKGNTIKLFNPLLKKNNFDVILKTGKSYLLNIKVEELTTHKIRLDFAKTGSFLSLEQHVIVNDIIIKSLKDTDFYNKLKKGNIITEKYSSKPKSKDILDTNLLADNNVTNETSNNSNNDQKEEENKIYSIQLLNSKTLLEDMYFGDLQEVKLHKEKNGSYIYYFGEYIYEWEATIKLRMIKDKYPNAKVFVNNFTEKKS